MLPQQYENTYYGNYYDDLYWSYDYGDVDNETKTARRKVVAAQSLNEFLAFKAIYYHRAHTVANLKAIVFILRCWT